MFHVKHHDLSSAAGLAAEFGRALDAGQIAVMARFTDWLLAEALPAGGIGPNEAGSVVDRHVLDALTYLDPLTGRSVPALLDIGSGAGLPGIPLAITLPDTAVVLLDRAGRRCQLARRAVRVLGLENVEIVQGDVRDVAPEWSVVTARAALPAATLLPHLRRIAPQVGIVGGSALEPVAADGYRTRKIISRYLESPRWLLIMEES
jgi:16S rRNA (guanine527-N7)-methyltransferase